MGDIKQGRSYKDAILNFSKRLYRQSLKKKFGTHVEKSMVFKILKKTPKKQKKTQCIISRNKVIRGKPRGGGVGEKFNTSQKLQVS